MLYRRHMSPEVYARGSPGYDRALGFFDTIYGFSLTLLIVNLDVPGPGAWQSLPTLLSHGVGGQLFGFVISFLVIAVFWRVNHTTMDRWSRIDARVIAANLVAAGLVIFIPFTTQGMSDPATADLPLPTALYAVNIALAMLAQSAIAVIARRQDPAARPLTGRQRGIQILDAVVGPAVFLASVPAAYAWGGTNAKYCWLVLAVVGPVSGRMAQRAMADSGR